MSTFGQGLAITDVPKVEGCRCRYVPARRLVNDQFVVKVVSTKNSSVTVVSIIRFIVLFSLDKVDITCES